MAFVSNEDKMIKIGDTIELSKPVELFQGTFETGTIVKITGITERGYDFTDSEGNKAREVSYDYFKTV